MTVNYNEVTITQSASLAALILETADFLRDQARDNDLIYEVYAYSNLFAANRNFKLRQVKQS